MASSTDRESLVVGLNLTFTMKKTLFKENSSCQESEKILVDPQKLEPHVSNTLTRTLSGQFPGGSESVIRLRLGSGRLVNLLPV